MTNADEQQPAPLPWESAFATNLKRARERLQMSQTELAKQAAERGLPYHQQTVQRVETSARPIRLNEAFVLADIVGEELATMLASPSPAAAKAQLKFRQDAAAKLRAETVQWLRDTAVRADRTLGELREALTVCEDVVPGGLKGGVRGGNMWHERSMEQIRSGCDEVLERLDPKPAVRNHG